MRPHPTESLRLTDDPPTFLRNLGQYLEGGGNLVRPRWPRERLERSPQ